MTRKPAVLQAAVCNRCCKVVSLHAVRPCSVPGCSRAFVLAWVAVAILMCHAAHSHARKVRVQDTSHPCPCALSALSMKRAPASPGAPGRNKSLERSMPPGRSPLEGVFTPGLFKGNPACKDVLQNLPSSWNATSNPRTNATGDPGSTNTGSAGKAMAGSPGKGTGTANTTALQGNDHSTSAPVKQGNNTGDANQAVGGSPGNGTGLKADNAPLTAGARKARAVVQTINAKCQRMCAVVGSSSRLIEARHGAQIDAADVVIRMNAAPTRGYEADVGNRTTLRFVFPKSLTLYLQRQAKMAAGRDPEPDLYVMRCEPWCYPMMEAIAKGGPVDPALLRRNHIGKEYPRDVSQRLVAAASDIFRVSAAFSHAKPTTGSLAVALALLVCEKVSLYGFGQAGETTYGYYYAEEGKPGKTAPRAPTGLEIMGGRVHNFTSEWLAWKTLHDAGMIVNVP